jgi:hypothetical protein
MLKKIIVIVMLSLPIAFAGCTGGGSSSISGMKTPSGLK